MTRRKQISALERELGEISAEMSKARAAGDDTKELSRHQESIVLELAALYRPPVHSPRQLSLAQASLLAAVFALSLMAGLLLFRTGPARGAHMSEVCWWLLAIALLFGTPAAAIARMRGARWRRRATKRAASGDTSIDTLRSAGIGGG